MEIFLALIRAKDAPSPQDTSYGRDGVAERYALSEAQLVKIEREGTFACWPPLD